MSTPIGTKAQNLIRLRDEFHFTVPEFIVVPFEDFIVDFTKVSKKLDSAIKKNMSGASSEVLLLRAIEKQVETLRLNTAHINTIHDTVTEKGWLKVSFRTSAIAEDGDALSFAGQYESFVSITYKKHVLKKYLLACFKSTISQRVLRYAKAHRMYGFEIGGAVIIQEMFYGQKSGVAFSENGAGAVAIEYDTSWKNTTVEGATTHSIVVAKNVRVQKNIPPFAQAVFSAATKLEAKLGYPVDIEWSYDGTTLALLQFRPQTTPFRDYILQWDSTNIAENYPGVTLPLTYSFIRILYARVYPSFFRLMGISQKTLDAYKPVFNNMLGYLDGHIYYRISNWYEVVKLIPGKRNQLYFEAMLNPVKKQAAVPAKRVILDANSIIAMLRFGWLLIRSEAYSRKFKRLIAKKLAYYQSLHWSYMNNAAIYRAIQEIRTDLLNAWAIPILNDIRVMIFHGILKTVFFGESHKESYLHFLQGLTDRASIKPLIALKEIGGTVERALQTENVTKLTELTSTDSWPTVQAEANKYITEYAARTPDELKLESTRLTDSVQHILELALNAARSPLQVPETSVQWPDHISIWKRPLLGFVAHNTRRAIDWRERFRFNRAQVFNIARTAFVAIGESLHEEGALELPEDIFWLTESEIDELIGGHAWLYDPKSLIAARKSQLDQYQASTIPTGLQGAGKFAPIHREPVHKESATHRGLRGNGVAPGILTAEVVVVTQFDAHLDVMGKILVTTHIDPGWTLLFTQAAGIITERGNALSHAAIIAREIGIPAVVAVPSATTLLKNGDIITMNGITGILDEKTA